MKNQIYHEHISFMAIILVVLGLALRYWIGLRRFKRRNVAGLQQFPNYHIAVVTTALERVLTYLAYLLIVGGVLLYMIN